MKLSMIQNGGMAETGHRLVSAYKRLSVFVITAWPDAALPGAVSFPNGYAKLSLQVPDAFLRMSASPIQCVSVDEFISEEERTAAKERYAEKMISYQTLVGRVRQHGFALPSVGDAVRAISIPENWNGMVLFPSEPVEISEESFVAVQRIAYDAKSEKSRCREFCLVSMNFVFGHGTLVALIAPQ